MRAFYRGALVTLAAITYTVLASTWLLGVVAVGTYIVRAVWFAEYP